MVKQVKTPCIGVCSTGIGDDVCRGCKRYVHEVVGWNGYSDSQKTAILLRLDSLLRQVMAARIEVFDEVLLRQQLQLQGIRYHAQQSCYSWLFEILKVGANQIASLESFGARVLPEYQHLAMADLKQMIDDDFFVLSSVHFERYFNLAPVAS